jgi:hypothetical protein
MASLVDLVKLVKRCRNIGKCHAALLWGLGIGIKLADFEQRYFQPGGEVVSRVGTNRRPVAQAGFAKIFLRAIVALSP